MSTVDEEIDIKKSKNGKGKNKEGSVVVDSNTEALTALDIIDGNLKVE